jgi:group I intron endonuclease
MEIKYTIYKLIDPITNQVRYIGLTFNDLKQRLKSHCAEKSKSHKSSWINQLKLKGMKPLIELIEENISSYEECCEREIYWIEKYKCEGHPLTNMATGGNKNKKMSDETRKKMSESAKNRLFKLILTEEIKSKISQSSKKRFEKDSEKEKLRISNKRFEDSKTKEQKMNDILIQNPKRVFQYDKEMNLITEFPSIKNAAKITGLGPGNIAKCCKHKIVYVGGFVWRFEGDTTPPKYKNRKTVQQFDLEMNLIVEHENIRKASLTTEIIDSSIRKCCEEKRKSAGGFIWKYK